MQIAASLQGQPLLGIPSFPRCVHRIALILHKSSTGSSTERMSACSVPGSCAAAEPDPVSTAHGEPSAESRGSRQRTREPLGRFSGDPVREVARDVQRYVNASLRGQLGLKTITVNVTAGDILSDERQLARHRSAQRHGLA